MTIELCAALAALTGCEGLRLDADAVSGSRATSEAAAVVVEAAGPVCIGTNAHDKHAGVVCQACHPCGGALGIGSITLPGGRTTAGGVATPRTDTSPVSCTVACHAPPGGTPTAISWTAQGPLPCLGCHLSPLQAGSTVRSAHPHLASNSAACPLCHELSAHMSGTVRTVNSGGPDISTTCASCHAGAGKTFLGSTPPVVFGWAAPELDFHGSRAGTGYSGTLRSPWARGQGAIPCTACHDPHSSANAFLLARTVNGRAIPASAIDRSGVGGEALCEACHDGARHGTCAGCHGDDPQPAGSACFSCHGHEGVRIFVQPGGTPESYHGVSGYCGHCHGSWLPLTESTPPVLLNGGLVLTSNVTATEALISWVTDEASTSYVELGTSELGVVTGSAVLTPHHEVQLSGLAPSTTYRFRVRTSDAMRNVTLTPVYGLTTACPSCVSAPMPIPIAPVWPQASTFPIPLTWGAVVSADGDAVEYRVVLSLDSAFQEPLVDSGWISACTFTATLPTGNTYYWRVQARDAVQGTESDWSPTSTFWSAPYELPE